MIATAIQQVTPALDYSSADIAKMMLVNYTGVFLSARACARQMHKYKIQGSMCLIASMSGTIANRGFIAPVYNSSKAAVVQLAKNLAMEWVSHHQFQTTLRRFTHSHCFTGSHKLRWLGRNPRQRAQPRTHYDPDGRG
jgi:NAD(P)-dependent dehydrogenase (short-subunit alcohol dehydrogenase family)